MTKQYAYVIKRDDGLYFNHPCITDGFTNKIYDNVYLAYNKKCANDTIIDFELQNCKPVKICIEECEDE